MKAHIEVRRCPDGSIDEIVAYGNIDVHIEQMTDSTYFVNIRRGKKELFRGFVGSIRGAQVELWDEMTGPVRRKRGAR